MNKQSPFLLGVFISRLGDSFAFLAFILLLLKITHSNLIISIFMITRYLPGVLIGTLGINLFDRYSKKSILITAYVTSAFLILLAPFFLNSMPVLLIISLFMGVAYGIYTPCQRAFVGELFEVYELKKANSFVQFSEVAAKTVGFLFAGLAFHRLGAVFSFTLNAGAFLIISALLLKTKPIRNNLNKTKSFLNFKLSNISFPNTEMLSIVLMFAITWLATGALFSLEASYARDFLHANESEIGVIFAMASIGSIIGVITMLKSRIKDNENFLFASCFLEIFFVTGYALSNHLFQAVICIIGYGFFLTIRHVLLATYLQSKTAPEQCGRVFGMQQAFASFAMMLGMGFAGPLSTTIGTRSTLLWFCSIAFLGALATSIYKYKLQTNSESIQELI